MTKLTRKSTKRRQGYEVCRLHHSDVGNRVLDTAFRANLAINDCTPNVHPSNISRLLNYLVMLEGEGKRRQSGDGILIPENRGSVVIRHNGGTLDCHHPNQVYACS